MGTSDETEAALRRAGEAGDANAMTRLGKLLEERKDLEGAESAYRAGDVGGDASGALNLGRLLFRRKEYLRAGQAFDRAVARAPQLESALMTQILICRRFA